MRLRHIEVFHAVYSSNSISNAARLLNVSQPSVSKVLRHAEDQLGYLLFNRVKGKLIPTNEGRKLYEEVSKLYVNLDSLRRLSQNLAQLDKGTVRIAITPALGLTLVPTVVAEFIQEHPKIKFEIETLHHGEIITSLLERKIDIGIAFDPSSHPDIEEQVIGEGEFVCLAPINEVLPDKSRISLRDLSGKNFISLNGKGPLGRLLTAQVENSGVELNIIANVETYHVAKKMVGLNAGYTVVDEITARSDSTDQVHIRKMDPPINFHVTALFLEDEPLSLICREFLSKLEESLSLFLTR
ncbi:LysR family transcriptional regulator [Kordiimonas sp. SCSIO 12610]|uniref:LysR family transcriptional regulator n=1 Tax=Kordiimonas sp. SCSIO 12610 TaxID=2829597 RepID=UPI00210C567F|nr:LysR substrate-binding domain-containing protein [Kordiimonas sp. SCSIO 12610]UTW53981.1 LysR family transcriptional regulator [Kordiimonas sp. SCSIO 12610]